MRNEKRDESDPFGYFWHSAGMAVSLEIRTGKRRVIEYSCARCCSGAGRVCGSGDGDGSNEWGEQNHAADERVEKSALAVRRFNCGFGKRQTVEECGMNAKRTRQLAALLLAAATVACAQTLAAKEDPKARLAKAEAMFAERCKKSGFFIHRTAENVEGILLMKIRPDGINYGEQYRMDDPYGADVGGDGYIRAFLKGRNEAGSVADNGLASKGYRYVEAIDEKDGKRYGITKGVRVI